MNNIRDMREIGVDTKQLLELELDKNDRMETVMLFCLYTASGLYFKERMSIILQVLFGRRFFVGLMSRRKRLNDDQRRD